MLTNTDATLYHRSYNPATRLDEWESTYIPALWWYEAEQSSVTTEGRKTADTFMVRIPDTTVLVKKDDCNGVQREHNKKFNNGLPILHKVTPKRDYGRYFCIMAEKGGTSHGGLTEKLSLFFHAKKQEVNAYGR